MGFKIIPERQCPKCKIDMIANEVDDLGPLCGSRGVEYTCPECFHREFDGVIA